MQWILFSWASIVDSAGVYKGLHHTSSAVSSILPSAGPTSTLSPSPAATTTTNNGTSSANHHVSTAGPRPWSSADGRGRESERPLTSRHLERAAAAASAHCSRLCPKTRCQRQQTHPKGHRRVNYPRHGAQVSTCVGSKEYFWLNRN